jgi:ribokinase
MRSVWIAGSVNMDVVATAARHPKIGETVVGREVFFFPGGKGANQAVAAAKLGAPTALIGMVGDDAFGRGSFSRRRTWTSSFCATQRTRTPPQPS